MRVLSVGQLGHRGRVGGKVRDGGRRSNIVLVLVKEYVKHPGHGVTVTQLACVGVKV